VELLHKWLVQHGAKISDAVRAVYSEERGTELVAAADIPEGEELVAIPLASIVTPAKAVADSLVARGVSALWEPPSRPRLKVGPEAFWVEQLEELQEAASQSQVVLAAFLVDHWQRGASSPYAPWLAVVPREYPSCPTLWTEEQVRCLGEADEVEILLEKQKRWLQEYLTMVHFVPGLRKHSYDQFARARVAVESRTHGLLFGGPPMEHTAFVPFADLLNHNLTHAAKWTSSRAATDEQHAFRIVAKARVVAGSPLLCSYGHKTHSELFRTYGFADAYAPRSVPLPIQLPRGDVYRSARQATLIELEAYRTFAVGSEVPVMTASDFSLLLAFLRTAVAPPSALEQPAALAHPSTSELEEAALAALAEAARQALTNRRPSAAAAAGDPPDGPAEWTCAAFRAQQDEVLQGVLAFAEHRGAGESDMAGVVATSLRELYAAYMGSHLRSGTEL